MIRLDRPLPWLLLTAALASVGVLRGAGSMALPLSTVLSGSALAGSVAQPAAEAAAAPRVLRSRSLRFVALADGREAVLDAEGGGLVSMLPADKTQQSFLRVTIRVLQEGRRLRHADIGTPFVLAIRSDDGLTLEDPLTHSRLAVRAFGMAAVTSLSPLLTAQAVDVGTLPPQCPRLEC